MSQPNEAQRLGLPLAPMSRPSRGENASDGLRLSSSSVAAGASRWSGNVIDSMEWRPATVRAAITMARNALDNVRGGDELASARAALECAVELLNASHREIGVFRDDEPYRLVLDPIPQESPCNADHADAPRLTQEKHEESVGELMSGSSHLETAADFLSRPLRLTPRAGHDPASSFWRYRVVGDSRMLARNESTRSRKKPASRESAVIAHRP